MVFATARSRPSGMTLWWLWWLLLQLILMHDSVGVSVAANEIPTSIATSSREEASCRSGGDSKADSTTCSATTTTTTTTTKRAVGSLRPRDLPAPEIFADFTKNATITLEVNGNTLEVAEGRVTQIPARLPSETFQQDPPTSQYATELTVLPQVVQRSSVQDLLQLLEDYQHWDEDPDTVDGMPSYEMFVDSPELYTKQSTTKVRDQDPQFVPARQVLRRRLQSILQPYLHNYITPFVRQRYPTICRGIHDDTSSGSHHTNNTRRCTPCYSLIRRYRSDDRVSHATHHDAHALVTVVVSLSDHGREYRGGLYVTRDYGPRAFVALQRGDAVVHRSTLLHGVQVYDLEEEEHETNSTTNYNDRTTRRWSWILWYRDSTECHDYSYEWFSACAQRGDPGCQQLHATKISAIPHISQTVAAQQVLEWNQKAAAGGAGTAAVKMARAYLKQLPSSLDFNIEAAAKYYTMAITAHHPDGHYGMAELLLQMVSVELRQQQQQAFSTPVDTRDIYQDDRVVQAVEHLESAALLEHAFAKFNLGMVHTYGYATGVVNGTLAGSWFEASGLPEGYFLAAQQAKVVQHHARYQYCSARAQKLGFTAAWRKQARQATGSGGAAGVSLNLPWPPAMDGRKPPEL